jgi:(2Fe-2S) ferredoxin
LKVYDIHIFVCCNQRTGTDRLSCGEEHGHALVGEFKKRIKDKKLGLEIRTNRSGCLGICDYGPTVAIYPEGTFYVNVQTDDVEEIIQSHIIGGKPVQRLLLQENWKKSK